MKYAIFSTPPALHLTKIVTAARSFFAWVLALMLLSLPRLSFAQDSWRYPSVTSSETKYVATNYNGGTGANPIVSVVASYMAGSGFNVKFVQQDGSIAF